MIIRLLFVNFVNIKRILQYKRATTTTTTTTENYNKIIFKKKEKRKQPEIIVEIGRVGGYSSRNIN